MQRSWRVPFLAAVLVAGSGAAGCGSAGQVAPMTVTEVVTVTNPPAQATATGAPGITVLPPAATGTVGGGQSAQTSAETPPPGTSVESTAAAGTTATITSQTTAGAVTSTVTSTHPAAAAARAVLDRSCSAALTGSTIEKALGKPLSAEQIRVADVANRDRQMLGRTKCYYGTGDLAAAKPLVLSLSAYADPEAAEAQLEVTVQSERDLGAVYSTADIDGHQAAVLIRDGGFLIVRVDAWTASIALQKGLIRAAAMPKALVALATAVLGHLG